MNEQFLNQILTKIATEFHTLYTNNYGTIHFNELFIFSVEKFDFTYNLYVINNQNNYCL